MLTLPMSWDHYCRHEHQARHFMHGFQEQLHILVTHSYQVMSHLDSLEFSLADTHNSNLLSPTQWFGISCTGSMICYVILIQNTCLQLSNIDIITLTSIPILSDLHAMIVNGSKNLVWDMVASKIGASELLQKNCSWPVAITNISLCTWILCSH